MLVGCLSSQQHASVSQGRICTDNFTCCHTEIEAADQTFHLTQSQYTDTGPTSPSADPGRVATGVSMFKSLVGLDPEKIPAQAGFEPGTFRSRVGRLTTRPTRRSSGGGKASYFRAAAISRVPDQKGISRLYSKLDIYHSGPEPSKFAWLIFRLTITSSSPPPPSGKKKNKKKQKKQKTKLAHYHHHLHLLRQNLLAVVDVLPLLLLSLSILLLPVISIIITSPSTFFSWSRCIATASSFSSCRRRLPQPLRSTGCHVLEVVVCKWLSRVGGCHV